MSIYDRTSTSTIQFSQVGNDSGKLTSIPGISLSVLGKSLTLAYGASRSEATIFNLTASSTITFVQTNEREKYKDRTATSNITFAHVANRTGSFSYSAESYIEFSQSARGPFTRTASNTIEFSQSNAKNILNLSANNQINFVQIAQISGIRELTASNTVNFIQSAAPGLLTRTAYNEFLIIQHSNRFTQYTDAIPLTASNDIEFSQSNNRYILKASATALTATSTLTFVQSAIFPIELTAENTIVFTQSSYGNAGKSVTQTIEFEQSVICNHWRSLTASNTINFNHNFTWFQLRNGEIISTQGTCKVTELYSPFSGGNGSPLIRPIPPDIIVHNDVEFYYPAGSSCLATELIILRTPNFGDRDRSQYNRINRESRGGSLRIFRDPTWPKQRSIVMDFSGIKDSEVYDILNFLEITLGQLVSFRDWTGRIWIGIITTPNNPVIRNGTNLNDLSLELEVINSYLELYACNTLILSQSADVVKVSP